MHDSPPPTWARNLPSDWTPLQARPARPPTWSHEGYQVITWPSRDHWEALGLYAESANTCHCFCRSQFNISWHQRTQLDFLFLFRFWSRRSGELPIQEMNPHGKSVSTNASELHRTQVAFICMYRSENLVFLQFFFFFFFFCCIS